jgi:hypothetical protein
MLTWLLNKPHRNRICTSVIGSDRDELWVKGRTNTDIHHHDVKNSTKKKISALNHGRMQTNLTAGASADKGTAAKPAALTQVA